MKNLLRQLLMLTLVGAIVFLYSCGDDEPDPSAIPVVTPSAVSNGTSVADGGDIEAGSTFEVTLDITAEGGINTIRASKNGTQVLEQTRVDLGIEEGTTTTSLSLDVDALEDEEGTLVEWEFSVVDEEDQTGSASFSYNVVAPPSPDVISYTETMLFGQSNASGGSFYDAVTDVVYSASDAFTNAASVDFVFWYGSTSMYAIGATDDATAETAFGAVSITLANMTTRNSTKFKALSDVDFDAIATEDDLLNAYGEVAADASNVTGLSADDVFAVVLDDSRGGKVAIVKVSATAGSSGADRTITFDVKIQPDAE